MTRELDFERRPQRLAALILVAACAVGACEASRRGIRRHPEPQRVTVASARAATKAEQWQLAASSWYELYLSGGDEAPMACIEAARALTETGDVKSARNLLDDGIKRYPDRLELIEAHAEVLERAGFRRAAEPYLERVLERDPDRLSTLLTLARLRVELSLEDRALPLLERRIALGGADAETWRLIARAQRKAGRCRETLEAYTKAFAYGENDPDRLVYAASLYVDASREERGECDPDNVRAWLRRAVELDPQLAAGHEHLGRLNEERGDVAAAIDSYRRALELEPARTDLALRLGRLHLQLGETARAAELARHALTSEHDLGRRAEFESWLKDETPPSAPTDGE